jgi:histidine phosphotransfer protein HptB
MNTELLIDQPTFDTLKESVGDDFIIELLQAYYDETPILLANLKKAMEAKDSEGFRRNAHSIKSTSNSFGALKLGEQAKELEYLGREGNLEGLEQKVEALFIHYQHVRTKLEELSHAK